MHVNEYAQAIGKIIVNLQSLEFLLRAILYNSNSTSHNPLQYGVSLDTFAVGDVVPENALTSYDSVGQLIDRYNQYIKANNPNLQVDRSIVELRDAFAHGRISSPISDDTFSIIKFDRPRQGTTRVTYHATMTREWLIEQNKQVRTKMAKVATAANAGFIAAL